MAINQYDRGDLVRCSIVFANAGGTPTDPTTVIFRKKAPIIAATAYTYGVDAQVVRTGAGAYYVDVDASAAGSWAIRWEGVGVVQAAEEGEFYVGAGNF